MTNEIDLLAHWSLHQKLNNVSSVQLRHSVRALSLSVTWRAFAGPVTTDAALTRPGDPRLINPLLADSQAPTGPVCSAWNKLSATNSDLASWRSAHCRLNPITDCLTAFSVYIRPCVVSGLSAASWCSYTLRRCIYYCWWRYFGHRKKQVVQLRLGWADRSAYILRPTADFLSRKENDFLE